MDVSMNRVFISHSSEDNAEALALSEALSEAKISYWLDEQSLSLGEDVSAEISRAIDSSSVVVFLLSKNANEKSWQSAEIALALSKGKKVFPLVITKDAKIPILLQQYVYLDISDTRDFNRVAFELAKALERKDPETDTTSLRLDTLRAKRELIKKQKEIYAAANMLKEREMKSRNFSLLFISLCASSAAGLLAFGGDLESENFIWSVFGILLGASAVEIGHIFRKRMEMKESSKELQ
jgi:hypothetical protein